MRTVEAYEAKTHLSQLLDEVEQGNTIVITRHGVPAAELTPSRDTSRRDVAETMRHLRKFQETVGATLGDITIRELIEEGRRY